VAVEQHGRRWAPSVRLKVLAVVVLTAALGMVVAETTSYVVQSRRLDVRIDEALTQEVEEFRLLAANGVDPRTGEPFRSVPQLLETALARNVAERNETFLALLDGEELFTPRDRSFELEEFPEVLDRLGDVDRDSLVELEEVDTAIGPIRFAAVPVVLTGGPSVGTYVVAYAVDRERRQLTDIVRTYALVALGALVVLAVAGWLMAGRLLRPLRLLRDAARTASPTDPARIPVRSDDDVGDLTRSFNAMLDRLQGAFEDQRRFLDDAGHELRTPVTIVRGHLELVDPHDPKDVAETRDLVLDEVDRMSRLVEDLVLLAQAQQPDFVHRRPVDVAPLVDDVLVKARALGDRDWRRDEVAEAVVEADEQRLQQALLQLADNAVKYTPPGTVVAVGCRTDHDGVRLWVRDEGPGIAAADVERVFERFGRAASVGRGVRGSGLGLSIVAAIAHGHGGRVELETAPGAGARFTLVLPVTPEEESP